MGTIRYEQFPFHSLAVVTAKQCQATVIMVDSFTNTYVGVKRSLTFQFSSELGFWNVIISNHQAEKGLTILIPADVVFATIVLRTVLKSVFETSFCQSAPRTLPFSKWAELSYLFSASLWGFGDMFDELPPTWIPAPESISPCLLQSNLLSLTWYFKCIMNVISDQKIFVKEINKILTLVINKLLITHRSLYIQQIDYLLNA